MSFSLKTVFYVYGSDVQRFHEYADRDVEPALEADFHAKTAGVLSSNDLVQEPEAYCVFKFSAWANAVHSDNSLYEMLLQSRCPSKAWHFQLSPKVTSWCSADTV